MLTWFYILAIGVLTLSWQPLWINGIHPFDQKRLFQVGITVLALLIVGLHQRIKLSHHYQTFLILLAIVAAPSVVLANEPLLAAMEWGNMLGLLCAAILLAHIPDAHHKVFYLIVVACGLYTLQAWAHLINTILLGLDENVVNRLPGFSNIRAFNHWQTWTLPIIGALPYFHQRLNRVPRYWLWALACSWWALLYIAAGRGTTVGILTAAILLLVWRGKPLHSWCKSLSICAIFGFALGAGYVAIEASLNLVGQHADGGLTATHSSGRIFIWQNTWQVFLDHIWLGVGGLHYGNVPGTHLASPHNLVLLLLVENGLIAGGLLLAGLSILLFKLSAQLRHNRDDLSAAYGCSILAASIHSLFSGVQLAPYSQLWLILIVGAYLRSSGVFGKQQYAELTVPFRTLTIGATCLLIAGVAYTIIDPAIPDPWTDAAARYMPRFWAQGRF